MYSAAYMTELLTVKGHKLSSQSVQQLWVFCGLIFKTKKHQTSSTGYTYHSIWYYLCGLLHGR